MLSDMCNLATAPGGPVAQSGPLSNTALCIVAHRPLTLTRASGQTRLTAGHHSPPLNTFLLPLRRMLKRTRGICTLVCGSQRRSGAEVTTQQRFCASQRSFPLAGAMRIRSTNTGTGHRRAVACGGAIRDVEPDGVEPRPGSTVSETKIYSWSEWERHRSTGRYWRHIKSIPASYIVKGLLPPMLWVCFVALLVGLYETTSEIGSFPLHHLPHLTVIYKPFEITGFALGLLLVFRTDASYSRYQSARHNWKRIITHIREIMRLAGVYDEAMQEKLALWTSAYAWCVLDHLTTPSVTPRLSEKLAALLSPHQAAAILEPSVASRPMFVLAALSEMINQVTDSTLRGQMLGAVTNLEVTLADCERILKTPIPVSYTRHTSRFLISYLTFLPFALWQETSWGLLPITGVVAFFLLGIDEIGVQIEQPFSIMPLERYCESIEANSFDAVKVRKTVKGIIDPPDGSPQTNGRQADFSARN